MDLSRAVVLLDEMDALARERDNEKPLEITRAFFKTSMLTKIAELTARARTLFFMATTHQKVFDPAIKRAGRFDLLVFVGPPSWQEKLKGIRLLCPDQEWNDR